MDFLNKFSSYGKPWNCIYFFIKMKFENGVLFISKNIKNTLIFRHTLLYTRMHILNVASFFLKYLPFFFY